MSDIELRVDQAFSRAVSQQVDEQREIRRLVARVDETLVALSDGMVDLAGQLDGAAQRIGGVAASPEDVERVRDEIADQVERVVGDLRTLEQHIDGRLLPGVERSSRAVEDMAGALSSTRADLLDALARLERDQAPLAQAVEESRRDVIAALSQVTGVLDTERDAGWAAAVAALDDVISRATAEGRQDRAATATALEDWRARADEAIDALLGRAGSSLADAVAEAAATAREAIVVAATDAATDAAAAVERRDGDHLEALTTDLSADLAAIVGRIEARQDDLVERLERIARGTADLGPEHRALLEDIGGRVADLVHQQHGQALRTIEDLAATRGATPAEVEDLVQGLARDLDAGLQTRLVATLEEASERTRATLQDAATRSEDLLRATALRTQEQIAAEAEASRTVVTEAVTTLVEAQTASTREVREATDALAEAARGLEPSVGLALESLQTALLEQSQGQRGEVDRAIAGLADASTSARDGVLGAVGRATARLAEVQAEGIGRLTAVADELGGLPDVLTPAVLSAVEQMQQGVAAALADLGDSAAAASTAAAATMSEAAQRAQQDLGVAAGAQSADITEAWTRLVEAQAAEAARLQAATTSLTALSNDLVPGIRDAVADVRAVVEGDLERQHALGAAALEQIGAVGDEAAAQVQAQADEAAERLLAQLDVVAQRLSAQTDMVAERLDTSVARAATSLDEQVGRAATSLDEQVARAAAAAMEATDALEVVRDGIPDLMGQTRQGLVAALAAAREEVEALLGRVDEATAVRISEQVDAVGETWLAAISSHSADLGSRTAEVLEATAGLAPVVEGLLQRIRAEVAGLTAGVEAALDQTRTSASADSADARDTLLEAVAAVQRDLTDQVVRAETVVERAVDQVTRVASEVATAQASGSEELTRAASDLLDVTSRLEPGLTSVVDGLREELRITAGEEGGRIEAEILAAREALEAVRSSLSTQVEEVGAATSIATEGLEAIGARTQRTVIEGMAAARAELAAEMQAQIAELDERLAAAGSDTTARTEAMQEAAARMVVGVDAALLNLSTEVRRAGEAVGTQMEAAAEGLVARIEAHGTAMRAQLASQLTESVAKVEAVATDARAVGEDLRTVASSVVDATDNAVGDLTARLAGSEATLSARVDQLLAELVRQGSATTDRLDIGVEEVRATLQTLAEGLSGTVERTLGTAESALQAQAGALEARLEQLGTTEAALARRIDEMAAHLTARLAEEMASTREEVLAASAASAEALREDQGRLLEARLERLEQRLVASMVTASRDSGAEHERRLEAGLSRLGDLIDHATRMDEAASREVARADSALTDLRSGMRADADALLDALAVRSDEVLAGIAEQASQLLAGIAAATEDRAIAAGTTDDLAQRVLGVVSDLTRAVQRVELLDQRVDEVLRRGAADGRRALSAPPPANRAPGGTTPPRVPAPPIPAVVTPRAITAPAPMASPTVCPDCGFAARTPTGLAAHRRTCSARP